MTDALECICGVVVPASGTDFEPGCRFCDRVKVFRGLAEIEVSG